MKYLLKIEKKEKENLNFDLITFNTLSQLIRHIFLNANKIKSYEIYEVSKFEPLSPYLDQTNMND